MTEFRIAVYGVTHAGDEIKAQCFLLQAIIEGQIELNT